jgi:hypothetical protein
MLKFTQYIQHSEVLKENLENFIDFASENLNLKEKPEIILVNSRDGEMTTANYCPETKKIKIYAKNRALFDIARSIAHELVHHMQNETGQELDGDTGSPCENEANAVAGKLIRLYGKKNPDFYNS